MSSGKPNELIFCDHVPMKGREIASEREKWGGAGGYKQNLSFSDSLFRKGKDDFTLLEE